MIIKKMKSIHNCHVLASPKGGWKQFAALPKTYSLMRHYITTLLSVDGKIIVSTNCPIIREQVAVNFLAQ